MSELPEGFVLQTQEAAPQQPSGLPDGFVLQSPAGGATQPAPKSTMEKLGDTLPGRIVKSLYSAATLPHDVMTGEAHVPGSADAQAIPGAVPYGSPESSGERIADLAMVGNPASVAAGTGKLIRGAYNAVKERAVPSVDALKAAASAGYKSPDVVGLTINPNSIAKHADAVTTRLNNEGFSDILAPQTFGLLKRLREAPPDSVFTGQNFETARRAFGKAADTPNATERAAATTVLRQLDEFLPNLAKKDVIAGDAGVAAKTLETSRANYSAAKRAELIDDKTMQAELRASVANSGQNLGNTLRSRMADVLLKKGESRGFSPEESAQLDRIARGSKAENTVRFAGNVLGGGGGLAMAITGLLSAGVAPAIGYGLRQIGSNMTMRQITKLSEMIRSNAPLASSLEKFGEKSQSFATSKSPRTRSELAIATRNLANNLAAAGITVTTRDLVQGFGSKKSP